MAATGQGQSPRGTSATSASSGHWPVHDPLLLLTDAALAGELPSMCAGVRREIYVLPPLLGSPTAPMPPTPLGSRAPPHLHLLTRNGRRRETSREVLQQRRLHLGIGGTKISEIRITEY
jgi:hypothetical protein